MNRGLITLLLVVALLPGAACALSEQQVELRKLADGAWLHTSYYTYPGGTRLPSNGLVVLTAGELVLIDSAWGERRTEQLLELIETRIGRPVSRAIITHAHGDRLAGVDVLRSRGIEVLAHPRTRNLAISRGMPVPDRVLSELGTAGSTAMISGLEVHYPGPAHTPDNLVIWLPEQKILFAGCAVRAASASSMGSTADADITSWRAVIAALVKRYEQAALVVPGHGESGDRELFKHTLALLQEAQE